MNTGIGRAIGGAWRRAEAACATLVRDADPGRTEQAAMRVALASRLVQAALRVVTLLAAAWEHSIVRHAVHRTWNVAAGADSAERLRLACVTAGVAAAAHLVLLALTPRWQAPLVWLLPTIVMFSALVVGAGARPLVRAWRERSG